jgi:hypothetical protein
VRAVAGAVFAVSLGFVALLARADSAPGPQPMPLGAGVTLAVAPLKHARSATTVLVPLPVTIANHGPGAIGIRYRQFMLVDNAGQKAMALLPSELALEKVPSPPLPESPLASGKSVSGNLYFHVPATFVRPVWLRVDLESVDGTVLGQGIVPL